MSQRSRSSVVGRSFAMQLTLVVGVIALAIWQFKFIRQAASADIYVFVLLFGTAVFGVAAALLQTLTLRNEFLALEAMREVHHDSLGMARGEAKAVHMARIARTKSPGVIYKVPGALGTVHGLLIEGLRRDGTLQLSAATMQVLQKDVEAKLEERQALAQYLGPLSVLLGLLGTFIGLLHTLESVGGILGSLDLSGSAGAGAIGNLIEALKKPLDGMATGFGASLFGLIGSLIIGVLSRIDVITSRALNHDFEVWLRSSVQIEGMQPNVPRDSVDGVTAEEVTASGAVKAFRMMVRTSSRLATQVESLVRANAQLLEREQAHVAEAAAMRGALDRSAQAQLVVARSLAIIGASVAEVPARIENAADKVDRRLDIELRQTRAATERLMQGLAALEQSLVEAGIAGADDLGRDIGGIGGSARGVGDAELNALLGRINDVIAMQRDATGLGQNGVTGGPPRRPGSGTMPPPGQRERS